MNKYQEALDELSYPLSDSSCGGCKCGESDCNCEKREAVETLQELVDRATPKKPNQTVYNAFCPNCKQALGRQFAIDAIQGIMCRQYCPNCGQSLDWRDE